MTKYRLKYLPRFRSSSCGSRQQSARELLVSATSHLCRAFSAFSSTHSMQAGSCQHGPFESYRIFQAPLEKNRVEAILSRELLKVLSVQAFSAQLGISTAAGRRLAPQPIQSQSLVVRFRPSCGFLEGSVAFGFCQWASGQMQDEIPRLPSRSAPLQRRAFAVQIHGLRTLHSVLNKHTAETSEVFSADFAQKDN